MNLKIAGLLAGLALSGVALAQGTEEQTGQSGMGQGGAGQGGMQQGQPGQQPGQMGQPGQQQGQLTGRVLGMSSDTLYIEGSNGAAIPVTVTHQTSIDGQRLKKDQRIESHLKRQMQQGEEVRTSFEVRKGAGGKMENVATSIEKQGGTGGAGMQQGGMGEQGAQGKQGKKSKQY